MPEKKFVETFRELEVYKSAFKAALEIYDLSKSFPPEERYSLTSQVRDSSRSVCSAIAEAWGKRRYPKHFASKLTDSLSEAFETTCWLDFALNHTYIDERIYSDFIGRYKRICAQLNKMIDNPEAWSIGRGRQSS